MDCRTFCARTAINVSKATEALELKNTSLIFRDMCENTKK
jgi:hypothetical protein